MRMSRALMFVAMTLMGMGVGMSGGKRMGVVLMAVVGTIIALLPGRRVFHELHVLDRGDELCDALGEFLLDLGIYLLAHFHRHRPVAG